MELELKTPIQYVPRVGPVMAKRLDTLGIKTVEDVLFYPPFRYDDFSLISPINRVQPGETVTIEGTITAFRNAFTKSGKKLQQAQLTDKTDTIDVIWFNQPFLARTLPVGTQVRLAGKVDWFGHKVVMSSPQYEVLKTENLELQAQGPPFSVSLHTGRLVPIYSVTEGVSQKWLRGRIAFLIEQCIQQVIEYLPDSIISKYILMGIQQSIEQIHYPTDKKSSEAALRRLAFDEFLFLLLTGLEQKQIWEATQKSHAIPSAAENITSFVTSLPFTLTSDQNRSVTEILEDIAKPIPMNRLLEGDVGSGKTVVAAIAMYAVFRRGYQSILMAPTQILAEQHHTTLTSLFSTLGIRVGLVTASQKYNVSSIAYRGKRNKIQLQYSIHNTQYDVLVGTHALLSQGVNVDNVALVVIDEQQRFGVKQRQLLREKRSKGYTPHLLTMTATPIPRTVALTVYGNLGLSVLRQMPTGRKRVKTWVVPKEKRANAYDWIKKQINQTRGQAFIICPLIEESETLQSARAATKEFEVLKDIFPDLHLALLHGRLKAAEKTKVLDRFREGKVDILVTTPVVEVGIDVPNATIMMIEAADRFGLSQLHQLRGRVGRGVLDSYCLIFTESDDKNILSRLKSLETIYNGPELAEVDLALRGPGELFGTRQHGVPVLKFASFGDRELIREAQTAARQIFDQDPNLTFFPLLREKLQKGTIGASTD